MKTAIALFILSFVLIGTSLSLAPFQAAPGSDCPMFGAQDGDSLAYSRARERALTSKFGLQDYGLTLLFCASVLAACKRRPFKAPRSVAGFFTLAVLAPALSVAALLFDLVQGQTRCEFPPWADSLGIPLMGAPVLLIAGLAWSFVHFTLLAGVRRHDAAPLSLTAIRRGHPWVLVVSLITALFLISVLAEGAYWYVIPAAAWLWYYASIAAVRYGPNGDERR